MNKNISIERAIELESWLIYNYKFGMDASEFSKILKKNFNDEEIKYLLLAYSLPFFEIKDSIEFFDSLNHQINLVSFIISIVKKYDVTSKMVTKRIGDVRRIIDFFNNNPNYEKIPNIVNCNKLVRDNYLFYVESNGEIPICRKLRDYEYFRYLLERDTNNILMLENKNSNLDVLDILADKLEVLREMAYFHGYTFENLLYQSNIKRRKEGGFEKRLLLEKIIKK